MMTRPVGYKGGSRDGNRKKVTLRFLDWMVQGWSMDSEVTYLK